MFRSDPLTQMIDAVAGDKEIRTLTMHHLKMFINAEWNTFVKFARKELHDHHADASFNVFFQFINDGCALKNKDKHQTFEAQFVDWRHHHNNAVSLSFRKALCTFYLMFVLKLINYK